MTVDFHIHTPASDDFVGGGTVLDVLLAGQAARLSGLVITDHNTIDGYLEAEPHLADLAPMTVFPGIEVTCRGGRSGIHVLGVFDRAALGRRPRWLLKGLGLEAGDRSAQGMSSYDVVGVCNEIQKRGGLAIAAHAMSDKGVLKEMSGRQLSRVLAEAQFNAFEISTPGQRRRALTLLSELGLAESIPVVSGTDSHRALRVDGGDRPEAPGDRATSIEISQTRLTLRRLKSAISQIRLTDYASPRDDQPIDRFTSGTGVNQIAVWRCEDRMAVTRAVAAVATQGHGEVVLGLRRGGRGGRGVVVARSMPSTKEVETWVLGDVRPLPAIRIDEFRHRDRTYLSVELVEGLNPYQYAVQGRPMTVADGKPVGSTVETLDYASVLQQMRAAVTDDLLARFRSGRVLDVRSGDLEQMFPWRGYLAKAEITGARAALAHHIAHGSRSHILRAWMWADRVECEVAAKEHIKALAMSLAVSEAKRGLRSRLDGVRASRALKSRVLNAFSDAVDSIADSQLLGHEPGSVLDDACTRLAEAVDDAHLADDLRDVVVQESQRANDLLAALLPDESIEILLEASGASADDTATDAVRVALYESREPLTVAPLADSAIFSRQEIAVVGPGSKTAVATKGIVAVHAPVEGPTDLLRSHQQIARFAQGHAVPQNELWNLISARLEIDWTEEHRLLAFRSSVRFGLPRWWAVAEDMDPTDLAASVTEMVESTRVGTELADLLDCLVVLPGDHSRVAEAAIDRSSARRLVELQEELSGDWPARAAARYATPAAPSDLPKNAVVRYGAPVFVEDITFVEALQQDKSVADADRASLEAAARVLKDVKSEPLFNAYAAGARQGWHVKSSLRRVDIATFLPKSLRSALQAPT